ncbi:MAG: hypothetical protein K2K04_04895, partial [Clostridia bacterium]|nr:hypothetical protein [Clostridia bacterium]
VSSWETDRTAPDLLILPAIADLYGVTVDEILRGERRNGAENNAEISEKAKRNMRKRRYAKYGTRRAFCLGFGFLGSLIFLAACAVMLYSSAPLWLSILLMVLGAGGCISCVILLACFAFSAERSEGIVLKEDYTEENKPYVQCVRHCTANSLLWLSLPHIAGVIVFLIVFFAVGYYDYSVIVGNTTVKLDYTTPTVTLVCLNAVFALAFIISGIVLNLTGIFGLGTVEQKTKVKCNGKLLGKICGFGAIPVAIALVLMIVFCSVMPIETQTVYFEAKSREEVYRKLQTLKTDDITAEQDDGSFKVIVPAGEYYLDFQSDSGVNLSGIYYNVDDTYFYELGNGFYGRWNGLWNLYYLKSGVNAEDIVEKEDYSNYLEELWGSYEKISVFDGDKWFFVTNVAYDDYPEILSDNWDYPHYEDGTRFYGYKLRYVRTTNYHEREGVFRYEGYFLYDYSFSFIVTFWSVVGGTVIAGTISYFVKRKKIEYSF